MLTHKKEATLSWIEYKTVKQFQAIGDVLDKFKVYGYRAGIENAACEDKASSTGNGHNWLTEDSITPP